MMLLSARIILICNSSLWFGRKFRLTKYASPQSSPKVVLVPMASAARGRNDSLSPDRVSRRHPEHKQQSRRCVCRTRPSQSRHGPISIEEHSCPLGRP